MGFEIVDRYLLGEPVSKPDVVAALLADRSAEPAAAPFYRAFEAVGARAADEAFIAIRLVLAGKDTEDGSVRSVRALAAIARAARSGDRKGVTSVLARDRAILPDAVSQLAASDATLETIGAAAERAFHAELA